MAEKTIDIASPILSRNERLADQLRQRFKETNTYVINVLSSPGSGKTTTILGTNERLRDKAGLRCAVIEGDIASDVDAITMKEAGMPAIQINTGGLCHLEGNMIMEAVDAFDQAVGLENIDVTSSAGMRTNTRTGRGLIGSVADTSPAPRRPFDTARFTASGEFHPALKQQLQV